MIRKKMMITGVILSAALTIAGAVSVFAASGWNLVEGSDNLNWQPTRNGYTFEGWYIEKNNPQTRVEFAPDGTPSVDVDADTTLYAKWKKNPPILVAGTNFNTIIKGLASGRNITAFQRSTTKPAGIEGAVISVDGTVDNAVAWFDNGTIYWYSDADTVFLNENSSSLFNDCRQLTTVSFSGIDSSNVTNMSSMFNNCRALTSVSFGNGFNTSNVTNMGSMFSNCRALTSVSFGNSFNTANVTNMGSMFSNCFALTSVSFGNNFNTSNVTDMSFMFSGCAAISTLNINAFNTSRVMTMERMFYSCTSLSTIYVSDLWTVDGVTNSDKMFVGCPVCSGTGPTDKTRAYYGTNNGVQGYLTYKAH